MTRVSGCELQGARLFSGLPPQELEAIAGSGTVQTLPANTVFIRQGEIGNSLYVILSGSVKVYSADAQGREQLLGERGVGDHLGEIAMVGDSVRSASVATLEASRLLVLSRRPFMRCLARNPQIGLYLDEAFVVRSITAEVGPQAANRYRAWSAFRRSRKPLILLIGGCTGTGKSTVAAELALRLDIGRTQSTDILREVMRILLPKPGDPVLAASTYDAWKVFPDVDTHNRDGIAVVSGFVAQADRLAPVIDGVVNRSVKEQASTIIEGIHLHPGYHLRLEGVDAIVVPVLLTVPSREELGSHFARRGEEAPARGATRYLENLDNIWNLQEHFAAEADRLGVAVVPNVALSRTADAVMQVITQRLVERFAPIGRT